MDKQHAFNKIKEVSDSVNQAGSNLENIINKTTLSLDEDLNYAFPIDDSTKYLFDDVYTKLDIPNRRTTLSTRIGTPAIGGTLATGLYKDISDKESAKLVFVGTKSTAQATMQANKKMSNATEVAAYTGAQNDYNNAEISIQKIDKEILDLRNELQQKEAEFKSLEKFNTGGIFSGSTTLRRSEINAIQTVNGIFNTTNIINHQTIDIGGSVGTPIALNALFDGSTGNKQYGLYDEKQKKLIKPGDPLVVSAITMSGNPITVTLEGIAINETAGTPPTHTLSINNLKVIGDTSDSPLQIRDLYVRAIHQDNTGRMFYHDKKLSFTINGPKSVDLNNRHSTLGIIEGNLSAEYLETRLRQDYENKFNKVQREAFEKVLADNPEFAKLNQAQKDRLYERMQDLGTIANPVKPISLGTDAAGTDVTYPVNDITFAPSTHDYSVMPNGEDYNGFKVWLANQAPKDVINDEEKYRQWLRNGLVASLNDGKTHYESFFADVLKQFTDDLNVKTTLNKTLLDFINDTNEADHVGMEAELAATLNATEPLTTHTKRRYQKLAFWTRGEPQNYLSFFSGQSHEFKNESITVGGKTFGYTGKLDIHGAQSMSMSLKMKEGQEQIYTGGNPVALVRTLLTSPDIEPPHARFHAGLSVVKSVTKIARENGISLRTALTPEMLETLPLSIRTTLENGENPMVEIEEENGKLVAKVFNLNLTTRRKENEYKMFDEQDFVATQSVRDLRQGVQGLLALTNQTMNSVYSQYREARFRSGLRPGLLHKPRYGGLRNGYKKLSFTGESISVGGKSFTLDCKDGLFTFSGGDLKKPVKGRNLGDLLAYNPALRGVELRAIRVANEKMLAMYQEKLKKQERHHNYGVIDEENHRVYIYDKNGNLGYYESNDQTFVQRWRQYTSGHRYGRIADENMPTGFRVMKRGDSVVDSESYENFLRNETVVGSMVRAMSRTHRALIAMDPR